MAKKKPDPNLDAPVPSRELAIMFGWTDEDGEPSRADVRRALRMLQKYDGDGGKVIRRTPTGKVYTTRRLMLATDMPTPHVEADVDRLRRATEQSDRALRMAVLTYQAVETLTKEVEELKRQLRAFRK